MSTIGSVGAGLIAEIPVRPRWAYWRIRSYAYHYLLDKYHQQRIGEYEQHTLPIGDAIAFVTGRAKEEVLAANRSELLASMVVEHRWVVSLGKYGHDASPCAGGPIGIRYGASPQQMRLANLVCRLLRPDYVLETGVAKGFTTTSILDALDSNGRGRLWSIELPSLHKGFKAQVGERIPNRLRGRWSLELGPSALAMPRVLNALPGLDVFVHDSATNYDNQTVEFRLALEKMRPGGVLICNMVNNDALLETAEKIRCRWAVVEQSKASPIGLLCKLA